MMRNLYEILGINQQASSTEIKKAYRRLAHRYHPDKNPNKPEAEERFKEVTLAYEVLSDPAKRRKYDRFGAASVGAGSATTAGAGGADTTEGAYDERNAGGGFGSNVGDVFSEIFGDFFGRQAPRGRERGKDRGLEVAVEFTDALFGAERSVEVPHPSPCRACSSTGAKPGSTPQICHACGGTGRIAVQQGLFNANRRCGYCKGRGKFIRQVCEACGGNGVVERMAKLKLRIPAGATDGLTLRYSGEGELGQLGVPAGDLLIVLRVKPHPIFRREGTDIHLELPITFREAVLGAHVNVPTVDGKVRMRIPPGTRNGRAFRLRGKGAPLVEGEGRGDQHVTVVVEVPQELTESQRRLIEALAPLDDAKHLPMRAAFWTKVDGGDA